MNDIISGLFWAGMLILVFLLVVATADAIATLLYEWDRRH